MIPAIAGIAQVTGGAAVSSGVAALGDAIAGLFGSGAADKARRAEIEALYRRAATGDASAFRQLEFHAFEKRTGQPGDLRPVPKDRSASPPASREAAKKALRQLIASGRALSQAEYYDKLGVPAPRNLLQQVVGVAAGQVADSARPVVREEVRGTVADVVRQALPWAVGAVVVVALAAFALARAGRR